MILTSRRNIMVTDAKGSSKSRLQAESALRQATIDRMIKAKIDNDSLEQQKSKDSTILTSPPAPVFESDQKPS
jgi:hypothetical protein